MANRIKGITVYIGCDTINLSKVLKSINKNIKNTQTQLKYVQKHKLLADAMMDGTPDRTMTTARQ